MLAFPAFFLPGLSTFSHLLLWQIHSILLIYQNPPLIWPAYPFFIVSPADVN